MIEQAKKRVVIEIEGQIARIETALWASLNMVEGDGKPPDWDYLRLVRSQLPAFENMLVSAVAAVEEKP